MATDKKITCHRGRGLPKGLTDIILRAVIKVATILFTFRNIKKAIAAPRLYKKLRVVRHIVSSATVCVADVWWYVLVAPLP